MFARISILLAVAFFSVPFVSYAQAAPVPTAPVTSFNGLVWTNGATGKTIELHDGGTYTIPINVEGTSTLASAQSTFFSLSQGYLYELSPSGTSTLVTNQLYVGAATPLTFTQAGTYVLKIYSLPIFGTVGGAPASTSSLPPTLDATVHFTVKSATASKPKYDNVLFLPGIEGSTLYDESTGKKLWLPTSDSVASILKLNTDGTSADPSVAARSVIAQTGPAQHYHALYKDLLQEMQAWQSKYHITATSTPYDWRFSPRTIVSKGRKLADGDISYIDAPLAGQDPYIIKTLKQLASSSPTGKVTIIAHSYGGLVAKALMQKLGAAETAKLIDKVILVASPQLGTPDAVGALLNGFGVGVPKIQTTYPFLTSAMSNEEGRALSQNMPMSYDLLPSSAYFSYADQFTHTNNRLVTMPVVSISSSTLLTWRSAYGSVITSAQGLYNFMTDSMGTRTAPAKNDLADPQIVHADLLTQAQTAHATLDAWMPPTGVHLYTIAGWGNETVSGVAYEKLPFLKCLSEAWTPTILKSGDCSPSTEIAYTPQMVIDGDGTVVTPSALWANGANNARYWVNLFTYNAFIRSFSKIADKVLGTHHDNIFDIPQLRTLLTRILTASTTTSTLKYISTSTPQYSSNIDRLHFILHSPLTLGFRTSSGQYTGSTATSTEFGIPGVNYQRFGEVQWLSVPKSMAGTVVMHGTGTGSFALGVQEQDGNTVMATTTFAAIPSATSTIATLAISPTIDPTASSTLKVDYGSRTISYHAKQGAMVLPDLIPPEAIIGFSTTTQQIEITGTDNRSTTTVSTTATSTTITDASGNWLTVGTAARRGLHFPNLSESHVDTQLASGALAAPLRVFLHQSAAKERNANQRISDVFSRLPHAGTASLIIHSLSYSTGTSTAPTTTLRYTWTTNSSGKYLTIRSTIVTPATHEIATYNAYTNKTHVIIIPTAPQFDLKTLFSPHHPASIRKPNIKTYDGLYVPSLRTDQGVFIIKGKISL